MNSITFSELEAYEACPAVSIPNSWHVEIRRENSQWHVATMAKRVGDIWKLYGIRYVGPEDVYPDPAEIIDFMSYLDTRLQHLMNKLIPSHQNANNE
jgi:hypothetical protein